MSVHALVIDDNVDNLGVLAQMLELEGVQCTQVRDPRRLDAAMHPPYDVVFLDLEMPGINGYELLTRFQADARFTNVPIVAYTVHVSEINAAQKLGFHSFLGKPLDVDKFPGQLRRILKGEPVWVTP